MTFDASTIDIKRKPCATIVNAIAVICNGHTTADIWRQVLERVENDILPHGSGFDQGCTINIDESMTNTIGEPRKIVIDVPYHVMNSHGFYVGWLSYRATVTPSFSGICVDVVCDEMPDCSYDGPEPEYDDEPCGCLCCAADGIDDLIADTIYHALLGE